MVFVAATSAGLAEALHRAASEAAIWCGSDTISEAEYAQMKRPGLTRFNYSLAGLDLDDGAIATVEEHHPGQTIWVRISEHRDRPFRHRDRRIRERDRSFR